MKYKEWLKEFRKRHPEPAWVFMSAWELTHMEFDDDDIRECVRCGKRKSCKCWDEE